MKKILKILTTLSLCFNIVGLSSINIYAMEKDKNINIIESLTYFLDNQLTKVKFSRELKDINGDYNYLLYKIDSDGYAVIAKTNSNVIEIRYSDYPNEELKYYVGALSFVKELPDTSNMRSVDNTTLSELKISNDKILKAPSQNIDVESNENVTERGRPYPNKPIGVGTPIGIADSKMDDFNGAGWQNGSSQCGAYAGAVALSIMNRDFGGGYYNTRGNSYSYTGAGSVLARMKNKITTVALLPKVQNSINSIMLEDYPKTTHMSTLTYTLSNIKTQIRNKRPCVMALYSSSSFIFPNSYGNHFVCAYQYATAGNNTWFKVHDNWGGNNRGWVVWEWNNGALYIY